MTVLPLASRALADAYGRVATDLRVSLTDRCNLRCTYCMPAEGLDWLPTPEPADRRRDRPADRRRRASAGRHRGAVHRRRAAAAPRAGRHRRARRRRCRPPPGISLTTNGIGLARTAPPRCATPARPGQRLPRHLDPDAVRAADPARPARRRLAGLAAAGAGRAAPGEGQRGADARRQRRRGARAAARGAWTTATSCASSSRCRWTPSTAGTATRMVTADEILAALDERVRA